MIFDTLRDQIASAESAEAVLDMMRGYAEDPTYHLSPTERLFTSEDLLNWCVDEISHDNAEAALELVRGAFRGSGRGAVFRLDANGFSEVEKEYVAWAYGLNERDLDLPAPFGLQPDDVLYMPEGFRWERSMDGTVALWDRRVGGTLVASVFGEDGVIRVFYREEVVSEQTVGPETTLADAMRRAELEALDCLQLMPRDREREGKAWDDLLTYSCNKVCERLWGLARSSMRDMQSCFDVPLNEIMAAQYVFYYTDGVRTNPTLREVYEEVRLSVRLSDLIETTALAHVEADLEWTEDHFQERGATSVDELASAMEYEAWGPENVPLSEQGRAAAAGRGGEAAHEAERSASHDR